MASHLFRFGLAVALSLQLVGCGGSGVTPTANTIQATPSTQAAANVVGGNRQTVSITFASSSG